MKYFKDRGSQYDLQNKEELDEDEEFRYTMEYEAQKRWLDFVLCEASLKSISDEMHCRSKNGGENSKIILPRIFNIQSADEFILITKNIFPKHIMPYLSHKDLLSLSLTCKTMNNIINNDTLMGLAIRMARDYGYLIINNKLFPTLPVIESLITSILDKCVRISVDMFTRHGMRFNTDQIEVLLACDSGDATLVDNFEENHRCNIFTESRRLFYVRICDNNIFTYYNVALVLRREYEIFRDGSWNRKDGRWGQPVKAEDVKISELKVKIDIHKVDHKSDHVGDTISSLLANLYYHSSDAADLELAILLKDVNFGHESPEDIRIPTQDGYEFPLLTLGDLMSVGKKSKSEILNILTTPNIQIDNMVEGDNINNLEFNHADGFKEFSRGLQIVCHDFIKKLADISFGKSSSAFMDLWLGKLESDVNKELLAGLPLSNVNALRFFPKEWANDGEKEITWWSQFFTRRNTIREGYIVFEN
jgi:hypothetical protein